MQFSTSPTRHLLIIAGLIVFLTGGMVYPFLPGSFDRLAMPVSGCL
ncbi:MAG: hypothetical protein R3C61_10175 [Bacteroidia bacterium]